MQAESDVRMSRSVHQTNKRGIDGSIEQTDDVTIWATDNRMDTLASKRVKQHSGHVSQLGSKVMNNDILHQPLRVTLESRNEK